MPLAKRFAALFVILLLALPAAAQDEVLATYFQGDYSFDYDQWPFGSYDGTHDVSGVILDTIIGWEPDQTESVGGRLEMRADTLTAWAYGARLNADDTVDMGALYIRSASGSLSPGNYSIDLSNYMVMFAFMDDISNFSIPEEGADMAAFISSLAADQKFFGTGGSINVTQVDDYGFRGSFSGTMADPGDFTIISISSGLFDLDGSPTAAPTLPGPVAEHAVWPSPFNPKTTIGFTLSEATELRVSVHDLQGRRLAVLDEGRREAGRIELDWAAQDENGHALPGGVYLYRIHTSTGSETGKMILLP
jgi:hypothetical protein